MKQSIKIYYKGGQNFILVRTWPLIESKLGKILVFREFYLNRNYPKTQTDTGPAVIWVRFDLS